MKIKLGIAFFPWFTSMQTKKLFSYFHVNVFFIGGDKCNQSSSRQGRRACRRGGGLLVLSSLGIIKQGNWKWYLIDTAISTARQCLIPSLHTPLVYVRPSRLPQVKPVEEKKQKKYSPVQISFQTLLQKPESLLSISGPSAVKETRRRKFYVVIKDFKLSPHQMAALYSTEEEHGRQCVY